MWCTRSSVVTRRSCSLAQVVTLLAFSFFRPRQTKVYAPKVKYGVTGADQDYDPPPPSLPSGFFAWLSPVLHLKEQQMIANIGLDATAFLRMLRMLLKIFAVISVWCAVLMIMFGVYNAKSTTSTMTDLSVVTIQNVKADTTLGSISNWCAVAASYIVTFTVMGFVWYNWRVMVLLRHKWFLSPAYQTKVYSRTIMVTNVPKEYRSDEGLVHLLGQLKVDGIKIAAQIESSTAGRRIGDFPKLVDDHNDAVKDLEHCLVKYLKGGQMASKRPTLRKGGIMCCGGKKVDAIDYYAKQIKFLHDNVEERRSVINSLLKKERKARKGGARPPRVEGENYGFVTFRTIAEAHRIARTHAGKAKELGGAQLQLAPMPHDIIWDNLRKEPVELASARSFGFFLLGGLFIVNVVPLALVSFLSALSSFAAIWTWLGDWLAASKWSVSPTTRMSVLVLTPSVCPRDWCPRPHPLDSVQSVFAGSYPPYLQVPRCSHPQSSRPCHHRPLLLLHAGVVPHPLHTHGCALQHYHRYHQAGRQKVCPRNSKVFRGHPRA